MSFLFLKLRASPYHSGECVFLSFLSCEAGFVEGLISQARPTFRAFSSVYVHVSCTVQAVMLLLISSLDYCFHTMTFKCALRMLSRYTHVALPSCLFGI